MWRAAGRGKDEAGHGGPVAPGGTRGLGPGRGGGWKHANGRGPLITNQCLATYASGIRLGGHGYGPQGCSLVSLFVGDVKKGGTKKMDN